MNLIIRWVIGAVAVWLTVMLGQALNLDLKWVSFTGALWFILVLAIVNALVRPIVKLFALPLTCLTFGLFAFIINVLFFWWAAGLSKGIVVGGFWAALFGSVMVSLISGILNKFITPKRNV